MQRNQQTRKTNFGVETKIDGQGKTYQKLNHFIEKNNTFINQSCE
jgi:hypothetical protein